MEGSIVALDSIASQLHIFAGVEVHIKLNLAFKGVQLFFALAHAANDHNSCDND